VVGVCLRCTVLVMGSIGIQRNEGVRDWVQFCEVIGMVISFEGPVLGVY